MSESKEQQPRKHTQDEKDAFLEGLDKHEPEAWKALVRFCLPTLVQDQDLLADILCREAERRAKRNSHGAAKHYPADHLAAVLSDLGLRLALAQKKESETNEP